MSLIVFNGSPRGKNSNSNQIIDWFTIEYGKAEVHYLNQIKKHNEFIEAATVHDDLLFVFPLYVDGMPAQVKDFFEKMYAARDVFENKRVTYIIHSGFSESIHCKNLAKYLDRFSDIMGMKNHGIAIIPGSEGFRLMPPLMTGKKRKLVGRLGYAFANDEPYDPKVISRLEGQLIMSSRKKWIMGVLWKMGLTNIYWDQQLKKNNAYEKRFDAPYI